MFSMNKIADFLSRLLNPQWQTYHLDETASIPPKLLFLLGQETQKDLDHSTDPPHKVI